LICSKEFTLQVVAPTVLLKICDYGTLQPLLIPNPASDASAAQEWNGTFDTIHNCSGDPSYFYLDHAVSIQGKALRTFEQLCSTPILVPQQVFLTFNFGTTWRLSVVTAIGAAASIVWQGDLVSPSPIGTYDYVAGNDPRLTLDICAG
jgi:hypothetical protein